MSVRTKLRQNTVMFCCSPNCYVSAVMVVFIMTAVVYISLFPSQLLPPLINGLSDADVLI